MAECFYCEKDNEKRKALMLDVCELPYSIVYLFRDQKNKGRCVVAFKGHKTEYFQLTPEENAGYFADVAKVAKVLDELYHPDKINYATYGDGMPHVHVHIVPKYKGGVSWGQPFSDSLPKVLLTDAEYDAMIAAIDKKQFFLPEIFFIGFGFMDMFKVNLKTEAGRKKEKKIAEIYGEKYAEYYHNCIVGGQITYALTVAPLGLFIGAMTNDMTFAILVVAAAAALIVYLDMEVSSAVERKHDEILSDYPEILSKLTLLVNAGMVIREAWTKVAYTCDRAMYKEMQLTSEEMNNGVSELDALHNFAQRCSVKEIRKFTSILSQNIQKGGSELTMSLRYMNEESWEEKKQRAKRKGETAGTKLMIPLMIMFVGILFMIIVPIFSNML